VRDGYAPSILSRHTSGIAHFLCWLKCKNGRPSAINRDVVEKFIANHLPHCHCENPCLRKPSRVRGALNILLRVVQGRERSIDLPASRKSIDGELAAYDDYLRDVRGLTEQTRSGYRWEVHNFLSQQFQSEEFDIKKITPELVREFINEMSSHRRNMQPTHVALRSYFRFKAAGGVTVTAELAAIPKIAQWKLARLPPTLTSEEIARLLSSFDRTTRQGRRDYAMARCLTDLGLRASETAKLQLDDIDWRAGTVRCLGKGQRVQTLPLTRDLGAALAEYLRKSRPKTTSRAVFMRLWAPIRPATRQVVKNAMYRAARRCGLQDKLKGPHVLRHSIAARLLAQGATLKGIADVLRHKSIDTTRIYTKVDLTSLRHVAMPWIGRVS
jgi:site-specific recombinase XerD